MLWKIQKSFCTIFTPGFETGVSFASELGRTGRQTDLLNCPINNPFKVASIPTLVTLSAHFKLQRPYFMHFWSITYISCLSLLKEDVHVVF